ncbi:Golgi to ER traffic protein 2 [Candida viswanathii]|uniref:Golgi to ER traffic protein 2 n=1 Tax=Candida viswanathii TaxID=5486 RepID=A0A367YFL9_9ASCO|nr:Golgi to ER traffic protein 2 [Candida viswanathii]
MSDSTEPPAVLSAEEKRRLLRERRQAKMAKGQATDRLNNILSQGSSVKATGVKSVLDEPQPTATTIASASHHDDEDPDIQDISDIAVPPPPTPPIGEAAPENIDDIFQKMLQQQVLGPDGKADPNDPIAQIMKMFTEGGAGGPQGSGETQFSSDPVENKYQQDLQAYNDYQLKLWKSRFLIVRLVVTLFNFVYHYVNVPSFRSSNYAYVRDLSAEEYPVKDFFTWFATCEVLIIATYYSVFHSLGLFHAANQTSMIMKIMSIGSMGWPKLGTYQPLVARFLGYYDLLGILFGDLSLVVVLFGLLSFIN